MKSNGHLGKDSNGLGLGAFGSSGPWEIALDQTTTGQEQWFAQVEGPGLYLYFQITSPEIVGKAIGFLKPEKLCSEARLDSLQLGKSGRTLLTLIRDTEFDDRFFLNIGTTARLLGSLTIAGPDLSCLIQALQSVKEDLDVS